MNINNPFRLKKFKSLATKLKIFNIKKQKMKNKKTFLSKISKREKYRTLIDKINILKNNKSKLRRSNKTKKSAFFSKTVPNLNKYFVFIYQTFQSNKNLIINKSQNIFNSFNEVKLKPKKPFIRLSNDSSFFQSFKSIPFFSNQTKLNKTRKNDKYKQKIGIVFYCDHNLTFISLIINLNNQINILGVTEIPIPGSVIGDVLVEDCNELANIALDSINLLDLADSPLLVVLSSSFFNIHTFMLSDLKQVSKTDSKVQSKSPYLPADTMVDFLRVSDKTIKTGLIRTIYTRKDLIDSWTNTFQIIDQPLIGLVPAAPHIFDSITSKVIEKTTILIDIECNSTNVLIGSQLAQLNSYKLPFGYSLKN